MVITFIKKKLKKNNIYFILVALLFTTVLNSQPYYYTANYILADSQYHDYISDIYRINLSNPSNVDTLFIDYGEVGAVLADETENWIVFDNYSFLEIMNINNQYLHDTISFGNQGLLKFNYLPVIDKFLIYYFDTPTVYTLVLVDPNSLNIIDTIPDAIYARASDYSISKNGNFIYFDNHDTIATYSISIHQRVNYKKIEDITFPGADRSYFDFRRNGIGVIENYVSSIFPNKYYNIYFLDNDSLSITITHLSPADGYVASNGKYLLLFNLVLNPDSMGFRNTDGKIKKTIQLPSDGEVMCFENYPNNVYYVKNIELPEREVFVLNMDSIFNVLDLTGLNPSSKIINSPSFTLTVNGHGFDTLSTIYFNDTAKTTTYVSDSVLTAEILASDVSVVGTFPVWVKDEYSTSDTLFFIVDP